MELIKVIDDGAKYKNKELIFELINFINDNQNMFIDFYKLNKFGINKFAKSDSVSQNPILSTILDVFLAMRYFQTNDEEISFTESEGMELVKLSDFLKSKNIESVIAHRISTM